MKHFEEAVERALAIHFDRHFNDGTENGRLAGSQICTELKTDLMDELQKVMTPSFKVPDSVIIHSGIVYWHYLNNEDAPIDIEEKMLSFVQQFAFEEKEDDGKQVPR
jgi:hypothetical protein